MCRAQVKSDQLNRQMIFLYSINRLLLFEIKRAHIHRTLASVNSNERNTMEINNNEFITSLCIPLLLLFLRV